MCACRTLRVSVPRSRTTKASRLKYLVCHPKRLESVSVVESLVEEAAEFKDTQARDAGDAKEPRGGSSGERRARPRRRVKHHDARSGAAIKSSAVSALRDKLKKAKTEQRVWSIVI